MLDFLRVVETISRVFGHSIIIKSVNIFNNSEGQRSNSRDTKEKLMIIQGLGHLFMAHALPQSVEGMLFMVIVPQLLASEMNQPWVVGHRSKMLDKFWGVGHSSKMLDQSYHYNSPTILLILPC